MIISVYRYNSGRNIWTHTVVYKESILNFIKLGGCFTERTAKILWILRMYVFEQQPELSLLTADLMFA